MTITITGNKGEFIYNIVTDGEKCSIIEQDSERILARCGNVSIKGNIETEKERAEMTQSACCCTNGSDSYD